MALSMDVPRAQARAVIQKCECHLIPYTPDGSINKAEMIS